MGRHGENIRKRKDGRWEARIIAGYDLNGKARYRSIYGKSYAEVKEKRKEWLRTADLSKGIPATQNSQKITVTQLMNEWREAKRDSVKETSFAHYTQLMHKHILPELGGYYVSALNSEIVNAFLRNKLHNGKLDGSGPLSPKTVSDIRSVLMQALEYARQQKYPCAVEGKLFYPYTAPNHIKVLSLEEQNHLEMILYYNLTSFNLGILTTLYSGLRIGEICALQWKDIHFEDGTIHINKTVIRIQDTAPFPTSKTKLMITHPKSNTSYRIIPIPTFMVNLLKEHKQSANNYLLSCRSIPLEPRSCLTKYKRILRQAGLESYTFHTLRHTFATRCIESGFDAKSLSEILGHSNVNTTLQRYVHPSMELKKTQMERLEALSYRTHNLKK